MATVLGVVPGVCARCEQGYCIERRIGRADLDELMSPIVVDRQCTKCDCAYERRLATDEEIFAWTGSA